MEKICLITFSNNADHQNVIYSMFEALAKKADVYTIGIANPKSSIAPHTEKNYYFDCPERPGIEAKTFRIDTVRKMAKLIRDRHIRYLYFESLHVWNILLMLMCPQCVRIEAVHDVVPHDMSKTVVMCTRLACAVADHAVLRNEKYRQLLSDEYALPLSKITCFAPWRSFPAEQSSTHSGKFLCFGRIRKYKGLDKLEEIIKQTPTVSYQIVGEPDAESRAIVEALKRYQNVEMVDREVSDQQMIACFHEADWIVLPYASATQSGVIADAYRLSRPVIAFDVGAIGEQIENGVTGFLIEAGNVGAFAAAVKKAAEMSPIETEQFSRNAYRKGYGKYAAAAVADSFLSAITSVKKELAPGENR